MQQDRTRCSEVGAGATEGGAGAKKKSTVGAGAARSEQVQQGGSRCREIVSGTARWNKVQRGGSMWSEVNKTKNYKDALPSQLFGTSPS